jgi:translation initiation factor 1
MKPAKTPKATTNSRPVYSTDVGRICPGCLRPQAQCVCSSRHNTLQHTESGDGIVRLHRETKGRKGKGVTLIKGLTCAESERVELVKFLKSRLGVGGSISNGVIELQTADREKLKTLLESRGYNVKLAGG